MAPFVRSEDDILSQTPLKLKLGETEYDVKILNITKTRIWRNQLTEAMSKIFAELGARATPVNMHGGLGAALINFPETLEELVFAYAPDLPVEKIREEATEEQMAAAFSRVMVVGYPFLAQLALLTKATGIKTPTPVGQ